MGIKNLFSRQIENKQLAVQNISTKGKGGKDLSQFMNYMQQKGWYSVNASIAMTMYNKNSALSDAVDQITGELKCIKPIILDKEGEKIFNHPVLDFLKTPNQKQDYASLMESIGTYELLTGNCFIEAIGNINTPQIPLEIHVVPTPSINALGMSEDYSFLVNNPRALIFLNGMFYYNKMTGRLIADELKELIHVHRFINYTTTDGYVADSILSSIIYELEILNQGNNHNVNLLFNGVSLSGVFNLETMDAKVVEQFKEDVACYFGGSANAGKYLVSQGNTVSFSPVQGNNKDMQQVENLNSARTVIYDRFQIPQPLRNGNSQTFSNYETAQYVFYDKAVLPLCETIFAALTSYFTKKKIFKNGEKLSYDETQIPSLQTRFLDEVKTRKEIGVNTNNEIRELLGYEELGEANDYLYQPASNVPVGISEDVASMDEEEETDDEEEKAFRYILKNNTDLTEKEIFEVVAKTYADNK